MQFLIPLAGLLGIEVEALTERVKRTIIGNAVMGLFGAIGAVFLLVAGFLAIADQLGGIYAALIMGGAFVVLALAMFLGMRIGDGRRRRAIVEKRRSTDSSAFLTTAALTALPMLLKSPILRTVGLPAAAIAAYMLTRSAGKTDDE